MIIFDNISSLILFKRRFTAVIVKSLVFWSSSQLSSSNVGQAVFQSLLLSFKMLSRHKASKVRCLSCYLHVHNPSMSFRFVRLPLFLYWWRGWQHSWQRSNVEPLVLSHPANYYQLLMRRAKSVSGLIIHVQSLQSSDPSYSASTVWTQRRGGPSRSPYTILN